MKCEKKKVIGTPTPRPIRDSEILAAFWPRTDPFRNESEKRSYLHHHYRGSLLLPELYLPSMPLSTLTIRASFSTVYKTFLYRTIRTMATHKKNNSTSDAMTTAELTGATTPNKPQLSADPNSSKRPNACTKPPKHQLSSRPAN